MVHKRSGNETMRRMDGLSNLLSIRLKGNTLEKHETGMLEH